MHRARAGRARPALTVYPPWIQIRDSWALLNDEVRILIFDGPAEKERKQRPKFCSTQLNSTAVNEEKNTAVLNLVYY